MTQQEEEQVVRTYNVKVQAIRDRLGKTDEFAEEQESEDNSTGTTVCGLTETMVAYMQRFYGQLLIENEPATAKDITRKVGIPDGMKQKVVKALENANLVTSETLTLRGNPKIFSINKDTPLPEGWPTAEELKYNIPLINVSKTAPTTEEDKIESARDNPLTKMILNEGKAVFDTSGYEQFIEDTKKSPYPPELEAVVKVLHEICKQRIMNKRIDCPICKRKMERNNSELYCKRCNKRIDGGSLESSLELFKIIAKSGEVKV